jgi:hypothetical protein
MTCGTPTSGPGPAAAGSTSPPRSGCGTSSVRFLRHSQGLSGPASPSSCSTGSGSASSYPLFGWKRPDGTRRFRRAYVEDPQEEREEHALRRASPSTCSPRTASPAPRSTPRRRPRPGVGIVFNEAASMVRASRPELASRLVRRARQRQDDRLRRRALLVQGALRARRPAPRARTSTAWCSTSCTRSAAAKLWDALTYGGASRRQPLLVAITTAGSDTDSICYEQHEYAERVLAGADSATATAVLRLHRRGGPEDDWNATRVDVARRPTPATASRSRPTRSRPTVGEAQAEPRKENSFKRYRLNIWTAQETRWIQMEQVGRVPCNRGS